MNNPTTLRRFLAAFLAPAALSLAAWAQTSTGLVLRHTGGTRSGPDESGRYVVKKLYDLTLGDVASQEALEAQRRGRFVGMFQPFSFNAAHYAPNGDGTWRMYNFRPPGRADEENERWKAYLDRPDVMRQIMDLYSAEDFGAPGEFIYKRARVPREELPASLNRASREALAPVMAVFHYNGNGAVKMILYYEVEEDGPAQQVFERLRRELGEGA